MENIGMIRRIDELGRIVIPKELRNKLNIKPNENLEIYLDKETIVLKKSSTVNKYLEIAKLLISTYENVTNKNIIITDLSKVKVCSKKYEEMQDKNLCIEYCKTMSKRKMIISLNPQDFSITSENMKKAYIINPIILNGDLIGSVVLLDNIVKKDDEFIVKIITQILLKYIEI